MVCYPSADDRRGIETNGVDAMKKFNITGTCFPNKHYMVDLTSRVAQIKAMVDDGAYFCINRGRQFGKTTTLHALKVGLASDYEVYAISFEGLDNASYETERHLAYAMMRQFEFAALMRGNNVSREVQEIVSEAVKANKAEKQIGLDDFSMAISQMCMAAQKPLVMIIDEVDQASNYDSFIRMLGLLRKKFLIRDQMPTFQSVILAGVYDIKNLKLKIRPEAEHQYNSPWNIAANFDVEMAFNVSDVEGMLQEYESDHHTGMDIHSIAKDIIDYTSGYPFLVSRLCMILDEKKLPWDREGFLQAERLLLIENNTLFDDMIKKLDDFPELSNILQAILYQGEAFTYNPDNKVFNLAKMFGYIFPNSKGKTSISNRIFETRLYNYFSSKEESSSIFSAGSIDKNQFIKDGCIDMEHLLARFAVHFNDIYSKKDDAFVEKMGRKLFLLYLKPIINGVGNYYIEDQTRDETRTDVIIDYLGKQYIIELKIWRGNAYNERGEQQIAGYLDYFHAHTGYLLSFCFNKNKQPGVKTVQIDDKTIVECVV